MADFRWCIDCAKQNKCRLPQYTLIKSIICRGYLRKRLDGSIPDNRK